MVLKDCHGGEGEGETLPRQTSCPAWPSSPPITGEGVWDDELLLSLSRQLLIPGLALVLTRAPVWPRF